MPLISPAEAWERIAAHAAPLPAADVPLEDAVGRHVAVDVPSPIAVPGFDRSAMDGYAVRAADTPGRLRLSGEVAAGQSAGAALEPGTARRIFTGGAIPPGADAVQRQEDVVEAGDGTVELREPVAPGSHIRRAGEDVRPGELLLRAGDRVTVQALTALASCGIAALPAHRAPRVAVLVTGDELVPPGRQLGPGQIHESGGVTLRALAARAGAEVHDLGAARDDRAAIGNRISLGLHRADVLLVAGGVSVGEHDHVKAALADAGVEELFWRVSIKPGKPLFCGRRGETWAFGLPGNPLSGVLTFLVFVEPLLRRLAGEGEATERRERAVLAAPVAASDGRTTYLTSTFERHADGVLHAKPTAAQGSAMTLSLARADGFVVAPADAGEIPAGATVDVLPL